MLENILELEINKGIENDSLEIITRYHQCSTALQNFLDLKISFQDYLDILESNDIAIDEYLGVIEDNLTIVND